VADGTITEAEARLAEIHRTVVDGFLAEYGTSTLPVSTPAVNLARSVRKILDGSGVRAREAVAAAEKERICGVLAALKVTLTRPGWGFKQASNMDVVPWEAVVKALGSDGTAAGDALARARKLGKTWAGLPPEGGASSVLREAGRVLLERIDGEGEARDGS